MPFGYVRWPNTFSSQQPPGPSRWRPSPGCRLRKPSGSLSGCAGPATMATPIVRIAAARRSGWRAARAALPAGAARWRCKACRKDFSVTSGTLFAFHKMPLRSYLMAIAIFANEVKGKSMLALSRDLGTQYKTAFVLAHKIREAMASEVRQAPVGGEGKKAEIDGAFFGGHVRSANRKENRRDRRLRENQSGKRKVVVVIRERGENGKT